MHSRLNLDNYPKCLILLLLDVASNIYKQHSYFPPNPLSSWCITTSPSTISGFMFRSLPDPGEHLLETAHRAMPLWEPSVHIRMQPELYGYSNILSFEGLLSPALIMQPEVVRTLVVVIFSVGLIVITEQLSIVCFTWNDSFYRNCFINFGRLHNFFLLISAVSFLPMKIFFILVSVIWYINNIFQFWVISDFHLDYTEINLDVHSTPI